MTILAFDIGQVRTGVAVSDRQERVARPLLVIKTPELLSNPNRLKQQIADSEVDKLLVGLPISLDGEEHDQALWVRKIATELAFGLNLPLIYQDERLTSSQAKAILREQGFSEKQMRGRIDMVAAAIFLQSYLDSRKQTDIDDSIGNTER